MARTPARSRLRRRTAACAAAALFAALSPQTARVALADDPPSEPWRTILTDQVKKAKGCDLREVLSQNEMKLGDQIVIEGRLACVDGREFTFTRRRTHQKFEFELCEPTVC